jgi:NAD(P)-dependent dehydrogenase (short-subunit alcohol dehydrogenase family)
MDLTAPARHLLGRPRTVPGKPRRVLITGAGSGLGLALAQTWAARGWSVLLTDRDSAAVQAAADQLEASLSTAPTDAVAERLAAGPKLSTAEPRIAAMTLDVTDDDDWAAALEWVTEKWGGLDVLVNNAGVASGGRMELAPIDEWEWIIDINLLGVVRGCRTFVPLFKQQGHGHIVNVASLAALVLPPTMASYNVVKSGVLALSETLRTELKPYGISTSVVCPNFFKTNLTASLRTSDPLVASSMEKLVAGSDVPATLIAERVSYAVDEGRFLVLTDRDGRIAWGVKRYLPPLFRRQINAAARQMKRKADRAPVPEQPA